MTSQAKHGSLRSDRQVARLMDGAKRPTARVPAEEGLFLVGILLNAAKSSEPAPSSPQPQHLPADH